MSTENGDFRVKPGSLCIDAGSVLTKTKKTGKGASIEVEDALFFTDGYGIIEPDIIRVNADQVEIVKVNYETNTITIDRTISWERGAPVSLDYKGKAPDIGAFEFGED